MKRIAFCLFLLFVSFTIYAQETSLQLPVRDGKITYEFLSVMDSLLGKEVLFKASKNWYLRKFPYGYKTLVIDDQPRGRLMAHCSSSFPYSWMMDEFTMKFDYVLEVDVRYGRVRLRISEIQPFDEIKGEENMNGSHSRSTWEERSLERMYSQYQVSVLKPSYMFDKLHGFDAFFKELLGSYARELAQLKHIVRAKDF